MTKVEKLRYWLRRQWFEIVSAYHISHGREILLNQTSLEAHDLTRPHVNCNCASISKRMFVSRWHLTKLINRPYNYYNGCRWCMPGYDTDMKR